VAVYFLPTIVALIRRHQSSAAIFLLNLLLGWTVVGWLVAAVWSLTGVWEKPRQHAAMTWDERVFGPPRVVDPMAPMTHPQGEEHDSYWEVWAVTAFFIVIIGLAIWASLP
jgi:hypothetical protein